MRRILLVLLPLTVTLALTACGSGDDVVTGGTTSPTAASSTSQATVAAPNQADVAFAQMMIPHHGQAIAMARLAKERAGSTEVKALAAKIEAAQQPEIETMSGWLRAWGADVPDPNTTPDMSGHGMSDDASSGMLGETDMSGLEAARGARFDRLFLEGMIKHHEGAVAMAEQELADGSNTDAQALARKIVADQRAEIAQMRALLAG